MGFIKELFTSKLDVNKVVETTANTIDKLIYTKQERKRDLHDHEIEAETNFYNYVHESMKENSIRSKARRGISYLLVFYTLAMITYMVILHSIGKREEAEFVFNVIKEFLFNPYMAVVYFFFGVHVLRNIKTPNIPFINKK